MKLLLANYRYFVSGGPERYLFNVTEALEKRGHCVIPFSVKYRSNVKTPYDRYFVPPLDDLDTVYFDQHKKTPAVVARTMARLFYSRQVETAVLRLIRDTRPQAAYILHYLRKISPSLLVALKRMGVPVVVRLSDYAMICPQAHCLRADSTCTLCIKGNLWPSIRYNCVKNSRLTSVLNALATWFHRWQKYFDLIDIFVTTNEFMRSLMLTAGWPKHKLTCIPTFTDVNTFTPATRRPLSNYIFYAGRLSHLKGVRVLIHAFAMVKRLSRHPVCLKIAGTGSQDEVDSLVALVKKLGLSKQVHFLGQTNQVSLSRYLSGACLTVIPSICFENLPNILIESLACGTPVLASDIGSLSPCITPGKTGDLFTPGSPESLSEKLIFYLDRPALTAEMADAARAHALASHSPGPHIQMLEQTIQNLL